MLPIGRCTASLQRRFSDVASGTFSLLWKTNARGTSVLVVSSDLAVLQMHQTILRLAGKLRAIVVVNAAGAILSCIGVLVGSSFGLTGAALGSAGASFIAMCIAGIAARESFA